MKALATSDPGITGGFRWNSSAIFASSYTPRDYAQAIITGLGGSQRVPAGTFAK